MFWKVEEEASIINTFFNSKNAESKPKVPIFNTNTPKSMKELIEISKKIAFSKKEDKIKVVCFEKYDD